MEFCILGPLQALDEGRVVTPRGTKQRALLALLVLHANETVSTDRLIDELWGEHPPTTARKTLQVHVSHLRKTLAQGSDNGAGGSIVTRYHGYELQLDPDRLDSHQFELLAAEGRTELAQGRPERAASALERALALWTGPPLADVAYEPFAQREIARLADLRTAVLEQLVEAQLELGRHEEVVPQLEALIREHPYRERLRAQLMLALYRCDRQAHALQAYHDARSSLLEGLGIEPGERLRELEHAILAQDPTLAVPAAEAADVPPELDAGTLLAGREAELDWLREHWRGAERGAGRFVLVAGAHGMGKTRLAAELARDVQRERGEVLYLDGSGSPEATRAALAGARHSGRPTLLVVDDVDHAGEEQLGALGELAVALAGLPLLVLATAEDPAVGARLHAAATLDLAPLDRGAVLAVARLYTGGRDRMEIPLEQLAEASGGIPQRVHRVASEWARTEAARRLGAVAARAATERKGLRTAEDDVAASVVELQAVRARGGLEDAERVLVACPFKGLASFELEDAEVFFGRERLVAEMVARLPGAPLMGIVGPSGSGKSSALQAGLLAALADGVLPGSDGWGLALLRPGEHPLAALEQATAEIASRDRLVIAVDQFEETFATCRDEAERGAFINALVSHARDPRRRTLVLMAVRADLYGRCAAHPELSRMLGANHVLVGPMRHSELRRAIELPARRAGLRVEPELVDALVADVEGEPGALPLLSTSLLELWQRRDGRSLRMSAYEHAGGVHGAVARLAESAYERLDPDRQLLARRLLLRLAGEGEAAVRRRVPLAELGGGRDQRVTEVLARLAEERLVTIGDGEVEIAHEALLREWPRLRGWLEEDSEGRRLQLRLGAAARQWQAAGRDPEELYRGPRLAAALDWSAAHQGELNPVERAFLDESRAAGERSQRRLRAALAGVFGLLVVAVIAGLVALDQRGNARDEAVAADAQRLGAQALSEDDLDRALLLARQGVALDDTLQTRSNLLAALLKSPAAIGVLRGDGDQLISMDLSPDERTLAFIDYDGTVSFVDTRTRRRAGRRATVAGSVHEGVIVDPELRPDVRFSPDGSLLAVAGSLPVVLDARTHRVLARLRMGRDRTMYTVRFSPNGRTLSAAIALDQARGTVIRRFDVRTGRPLGAERHVSRDLVTLMLSRDGRRMITTGSGEDTLVSDARTLRPLARLPIGAEQAALSPDDRTMLAGGRDGSVHFVDVATGNVRRASGRHDGAVAESAFSPDGRTAITAGEDGRLIVWDVRRASAGETLEGHSGQITGLAISRDSSTLYTTGLDGKVLIWDLAGSRRLGRPFRAGRSNPEFPRFALSPDGRLLALGQLDGTVALVDASTLRPLSEFRVTRGPVQGMGFVPRGRLLVVGADDGFLALVDPGRGRIVKPLGGHDEKILTPTFSADGRLMATASDVQGDPGDGEVRLWALPSGAPVGAPLRYPTVGDVSLSPDGRTLAVTHPPAGGVEIVDVAKRDSHASLAEAETVWDLARFTPDGRHLVGASYKGWARLWSAEEPGPFNLASPWKPASPPFSGHAGRVEWQSVSPDSRTLATGSTDGTIRLWDLPTQEPLGTPLPGLPNRYLLPQFTPDGAHLFAITDAGRAYRWDVRPSSWARHACAVAGRRLTRSEWKDALPERNYDPAC
jgi:WD40 repeat protein/DNA-binding SARP family transcriptional activator/ABC-type cobalamin/Fe3+-siderophores transport system ATPase subunit